jgi:general secretion pathway protein D
MILMPTSHYRRLTIITTVILSTLFIPDYAFSEPVRKANEDKGATLNFPPNTDIREFIAAISGRLGKNFLIDPRVNGKVTVMMKAPLSKESIYDVFLDVLRTNNYAAIEQGDVIKVVPLQEVTKHPTSSSKNMSGGAEQVTRIVKIKNVSAAQLMSALRPLMPGESLLQINQETNTLIVSDSKKNVQRLLELIKNLDQPSHDRDEIVPLYQANAEDVLKVLRETQQRKTETSAILSLDKRSNSIVISGNKGERDRYLKMIRDLDMPIPNQSGHHVVPLKYAKAVELAPILDKVINKTASSSSVSISTIAPTPAPAVNPAAMTTTHATGASSIASGTSIVADEVTNSLIISADFQSYQGVLEILRQLDIPRLQVMIEAIIAEVSFDDSRKLGVEWGVKSSGKNHNAGVANQPQSNGLLGFIGDLANSDLTKALLTGGFSALISKGDIGVMLHAIQNDTNANILSAPHILTLNNKEAEMVVGENVPFITGTYTQPTGGAATNPFTTVQRQDVGLILKVKPQINQGGMISLEISQETSAVKDTSSSAGITTTKRAMKSNVLVANGNMLVLGGLMDDQTSDGGDSLPILGDIPILGYLFKTQKTSIRKRTLMVFIKPTIVDSQETNNPITQKAISAVEKEQKVFNQQDLLLTPEEKRYQIVPKVDPLPELDSAVEAVSE